MADFKYIKAKIRDSQQVLFQGEVDRISSFNEVGPFDIYPQHANFISIIKDKLTLYKDKQIVKEVTFEKAIMKVKKDEVKIFLGIETIDLDTDDQTTKPIPNTQKQASK